MSNSSKKIRKDSKDNKRKTNTYKYEEMKRPKTLFFRNIYRSKKNNDSGNDEKKLQKTHRLLINSTDDKLF